MERIVKYEMSESEHKELEYKLGLLSKTIQEERSRLYEIKNKTDSEVISHNNMDYASSLLWDIRKLADCSCNTKDADVSIKW